MDYTISISAFHYYDPEQDQDFFYMATPAIHPKEAAIWLGVEESVLHKVADAFSVFGVDSFEIRFKDTILIFSKKQDELAAYAADAHNCVSHHHYDDDGHKRCVICDEIIDVHQDGTLW